MNIDFMNIEEYAKHIQEFVKKKYTSHYPLTDAQIKSMWERRQKMDEGRF